MVRSERPRTLLSLLFTLLVLAALYLTGPADAVEFSIKQESGQEVKSFVTELDVKASDVPVDSVNVKINDVTCEFPITGGKSLTDHPLCKRLNAERVAQ